MVSSFIEQARRRQIIEATIHVLARQGYAHTSLARIAQEAGISKSIISYHFAGKDELLEQVFAHVADSAGGFIAPFMEQASDPMSQIAAYIRQQFMYMAGHRDELLAIGTIAINHLGPGGPPDYIARADSEERAILSDLVEAGQAAGQIRPLDAPILASIISKAIGGALAEWAEKPETDLETYADELAGLLARGMGTDVL